MMSARAPFAVLMILALLPGCAVDRSSAFESTIGEKAEERGVDRPARPDGERTKPSHAMRSEEIAPAGGAASGPLGRFSRTRAMRDVRHLSRRIRVRVRAGRKERRASRYVKRRFESMGYRVHVQRFSVDGGTSRNIVARWPGIVEHPFVIGGHIDTVARSPGANDNASGVAVVLDMARIVAGTARARFVKFVAFGSEEYGRNGRHHEGSQAFVNRLGPEGRRRHPGMISVDMVADGKPLIVGTTGMGPTVVAKSLYRKIRRAGIRVVYRTTCDCSDNGPFEIAGIPGSFAWSGFETDWHEPSDTVANMKPLHLGRSGRAIRAFVKDLGPRMLRRFRRF